MIRNNFQNPNRASFGRCTACGLRSLSICGALDDADISEFERMARHVHLAPNEALFTAGEVAGAVHSMMSGVVRLYKLMPDGRRQVLGFALPGIFSASHRPIVTVFQRTRSIPSRRAAFQSRHSRISLRSGRSFCAASTNSRPAN